MVEERTWGRGDSSACFLLHISEDLRLVICSGGVGRFGYGVIVWRVLICLVRVRWGDRALSWLWVCAEVILEEIRCVVQKTIGIGIAYMFSFFFFLGRVLHFSDRVHAHDV